MSGSTNPTVGLLNAYRPNVLDGLRRAHPEAAATLEPRGLVMGNPEGAALRDAALALLDNTGAIAEEAIAAAKNKLRAARRLELAGSIVAVASSAGVISALAGLLRAGALPLAIISFVAGALPLVTGWLRNTDGGASVAEAMARLRAHAWDASELRGRISRGENPPDLVEKVNILARKLAEELATLGSPAAVRPL